MKVLKPLVLLCLSFSFGVANEQNLSFDSYISNLKQKSFSYDYEKNKQESLKLRDSWIAPVRTNYSYSRSNPYGNEQISQSAAIRIDQPIFQSGGIIYGIKFAKANRLYNDVSIDVAKRKMIKQAVNLLMQIQQTQLREQKQELLIANAKINLQQKQEQYLSGDLDSGFLDNAIIQKNLVQQTLFDIQTTKQRLVSSFQSLSDLDYKNAPIPHLEYLSGKEFLKYNIVLQQTRYAVEKNRYGKDVRVAKYLPKVNLTGGYNWSKTDNQTFQVGSTFVDNSNEMPYYDYGLRVSIPLDMNTFRDIESAKVDYLKSKVIQEDTKRQLNALYEQVMHNLQNIDKKIALSNENKKLYTKLLRDTQELFDAGYKTKYDVQTLQNSLAIQNIDTKIYEFDKQMELLNLYEMYVKSGD
jgi:outer membrane protein TolC